MRLAPSRSRRSNRAYHRFWAVRRRRSGGQLKVQVGRSTTSRQTTTGTNALEVDMPPRHQRDTLRKAAGGGHDVNCATDTDTCPNRARFALTLSKSPLWKTGCMTVRTAPAELPGLVATPGRPFGIYIHVPFCATRCGYCDFNTYTPTELGGANPEGWLAALRTELGLAADRLGSPHRLGPPHVRRQVDTVFVGGGTPSLLGGAGLAAVLDAVRAQFTLAADAEVTTEANPEWTS